MNDAAETVRRVFTLTLEDLRDDAVRKKGTLNRADVDALYLKRGIAPKEAIAIEKVLTAAGVDIIDRADDHPEMSKYVDGTTASGLDHLMRFARRHPLLTYEEEIEYGKAIQYDQVICDEPQEGFVLRIRERAERARNKLITRNIRLVLNLAFNGPYRGQLDIDDLVQMGLIGLMKAAEKYDPSWETRFSTYATWWIQQAISRGVADHGTTVRVPVHMRQAISTYRRTSRTVEAADGRKGDLVTLTAEKLGWTKEYTAKVATFAEQRTISIDAPVGDDKSLIWRDVLKDESAGPEDLLIQRDTAARIRTLIDTLDGERLSDVAIRRFGFNGKQETLQEIGDKYGVSRERIRQIEAKALKRLRKRVVAAQVVPPNWGSREV